MFHTRSATDRYLTCHIIMTNYKRFSPLLKRDAWRHVSVDRFIRWLTPSFTPATPPLPFLSKSLALIFPYSFLTRYTHISQFGYNFTSQVLLPQSSLYLLKRELSLRISLQDLLIEYIALRFTTAHRSRGRSRRLTFCCMSH